jgi:hypothetical protein
MKTPKDYTGELKIEGLVEITNGDFHYKGKNHFVQNMLWGIVDWLGIGNTGSAYSPAYNWSAINQTYMVLGTDTSTVTTYAMNGLVSPMNGGSGNGIPPKAQSGTIVEFTNGYGVSLTGLWNANTPNITGTVGELGLYFYLPHSSSLSTTTLSQNASSGTNVIHVSSTSLFSTGDSIWLNKGNATQELLRITGIPSGEFDITPALTFSHSLGESIAVTVSQFGNNYPPQHTLFASRLSHADGDFPLFTINTNEPLAVNWIIQFIYS